MGSPRVLASARAAFRRGRVRRSNTRIARRSRLRRTVAADAESLAGTIARETGKPLWEGRPGSRLDDRQGRDLDRAPRPNAPASGAAQMPFGERRPAPPPAWRDGGARPVQFSRPSAQRPHRARAAGGQHGGVQAIRADPGDRRGDGRPLAARRACPTACSTSSRAGAIPARRWSRGDIDGLLFTGSAAAGAHFRRAVRRPAGGDAGAGAGRQQSADRLGRRRARSGRFDRRAIRLHHRAASAAPARAG